MATTTTYPCVLTEATVSHSEDGLPGKETAAVMLADEYGIDMNKLQSLQGYDAMQMLAGEPGFMRLLFDVQEEMAGDEMRFLYDLAAAFTSLKDDKP